jgi:hypothetical protein
MTIKHSLFVRRASKLTNQQYKSAITEMDSKVVTKSLPTLKAFKSKSTDLLKEFHYTPE